MCFHFSKFFYSSSVFTGRAETSYLFKDIFLPDRHVVFSSVRHQVILTRVALRNFQASFVTPGGLLTIKREPQHRTDIRLTNPPVKTHFKLEHIFGLPILGRHRISEQSYS